MCLPFLVSPVLTVLVVFQTDFPPDRAAAGSCRLGTRSFGAGIPAQFLPSSVLHPCLHLPSLHEPAYMRWITYRNQEECIFKALNRRIDGLCEVSEHEKSSILRLPSYTILPSLRRHRREQNNVGDTASGVVEFHL
ncbi:hypothetical protein BV25DRAFT_1421672 [Artomyces pyxidatus]|uniref:Uncharacterized protein n=1 Tax=Artomyces pyxidatus TaxID=48021 RepID=A0ACB8TEB4_9AGAM|nr:hypothetical protein BV25DRAFT_1421672 [Artomyces pyxidatus]